MLGLVFLFIICIRFPKGKSIANLIRSRCGEAFVRIIRKFGKNDYNLWKGHLNLRFLQKCKQKNLMQKFLQFKLASKHLHNSVAYKKCQIKLLEGEIRAKRKRINILKKYTQMIREELQGTISCLNIWHICCLVLVANDKSVLHHDNIQKWKLKNLLEISLQEVINDNHNPSKMILIFLLTS